MADITMCHGEECPKKNDCYRYRAIPEDASQTYFRDPPIKENICSFFWPIGHKTKDIRSLDEFFTP